MSKELGDVALVGGPFDGQTHSLKSPFGIGVFPSVIKLPIAGPDGERACYRLDEMTETYHFTKMEPPHAP